MSANSAAVKMQWQFSTLRMSGLWIETEFHDGDIKSLRVFLGGAIETFTFSCNLKKSIVGFFLVSGSALQIYVRRSRRKCLLERVETSTSVHEYD